MSITTSASILVHDAGQLTPDIVPVSNTNNVLLRLAAGAADAPIVLADTPAALLGLLTRALVAVGSVVEAERESLIETLDILSDDDTMAALAEAEREDVRH